MIYELKIRSVGNSDGLVLPKELLACLRAGRGDKIYATEVQGGIKLTVYDEKSAEQMKAAERIMKKRRNVLKALSR